MQTVLKYANMFHLHFRNINRKINMIHRNVTITDLFHRLRPRFCCFSFVESLLSHDFWLSITPCFLGIFKPNFLDTNKDATEIDHFCNLVFLYRCPYKKKVKFRIKGPLMVLKVYSLDLNCVASFFEHHRYIHVCLYLFCFCAYVWVDLYAYIQI